MTSLGLVALEHLTWTQGIMTLGPPISVALTQLSNFATLRNKIVKIVKIFLEIDHLRSPGVLC